MIGAEPPARGGAQQVVVADRLVGAGGLGEHLALRPFELDRRDREEQRAGETAARSDPGLRDRLLDGDLGEALGHVGRRQRLDGDEIDGTGDPGLEAVGGETGDGVNARLARGEPLPVVGLPRAERGDEAAAGDDDDRPSGLIAHGCHTNLPGPFAAPALHGPEIADFADEFTLKSTAHRSSINRNERALVDPLHQRQTLAAPVPDAGHQRLRERAAGRPLESGRIVRGEQLRPVATRWPRARRSSRIAAPPHDRYGCRWRAPQVRDGAPRKARSSAVAGSTPVRAGNECAAGAAHGGRDLVPQPAERRGDVAGLAVGARIDHAREPRQRLRAAGLGVVAALQHQEGAHRAERKARMRPRAPIPGGIRPVRLNRANS